MRVVTPAICAALLAGCVSLGPSASEMAQIEATRPVCNDEKECAAMWDAAQLWIVKHADMKLQTVTGVIIETYNVPSGSAGLAMSVTKEPIGQGRYKIVAHATCTLACVIQPVAAVFDFNASVGPGAH